MRINKFTRTVCHTFGLVLLLLAASCSRQPVSMALPSDIDPAELRQRIQKPVQVVGKSGTQLVVSPGYVGACKGWEMGTSKISWKADPGKAPSIRVEVSDSSSETRKVFAGGGASGESMAEGWFSEGVTFYVVADDSNADLVSYTVQALDCARQ